MSRGVARLTFDVWLPEARNEIKLAFGLLHFGSRGIDVSSLSVRCERDKRSPQIARGCCELGVT